jgi:hypothetical protein
MYSSKQRALARESNKYMLYNSKEIFYSEEIRAPICDLYDFKVKEIPENKLHLKVVLPGPSWL